MLLSRSAIIITLIKKYKIRDLDTEKIILWLDIFWVMYDNDIMESWYKHVYSYCEIYLLCIQYWSYSLSNEILHSDEINQINLQNVDYIITSMGFSCATVHPYKDKGQVGDECLQCHELTGSHTNAGGCCYSALSIYHGHFSSYNSRKTPHSLVVNNL